jgi:hypothetical protein
MGPDNDLGESKVVTVDRGLFLIEYKSASDETAPPKVVVALPAGQRAPVEILTHPDSDGQTLWQPGSSLVVRALERVNLQVTVRPMRPGTSRAAEVRIQPIGQGTVVLDRPIDLESVRLVGHVAGLGDISVGLGEWIAGPTAPSRIEGLAVQWPDQPQGLEMKYSVKAGVGQGPMGRLVGSGEFAGTRGRALPLTGVIFELSGALAKQYNLTADAIFLSQPTMRVTGKRIVLSGPTGQEPLVGFRLQMEAAEEALAPPVNKQTERKSSEPAAPVMTKSSRAGRVRVFRSRSLQASK